MRPYLDVLRQAGFRRLWIGSTISTLGDGMTFVALSWLVLSRPGGTAQLGLLGICYTAPVMLGGLVVGPLLDRFDKRAVLAADSLARAAAVVSVPLTAGFGETPGWLPFAVATCYGLLKMVPLAGFPAAIPQLVDPSRLDAANALETLSFSVAGIAGPALAGLLLGHVGVGGVLLADSASFVIFAASAALVGRPLGPPAATAAASAASRPALAGLLRDRVIVSTTVAFMAFNIAEGMLMVAAPWLAKNHLPGGTATLGSLLSAMAAGEAVGAVLAGRHRRAGSRPRAIGLAQVAAGTAFLALLATSAPLVAGAGFFAIGLLTAPMTVWAQTLRMRRIPQALHGRAFAALRTLMQATPPAGSALVTPFLLADRPGGAVVVMALIASVPGAWLLTVGAREPVASQR